MAAKPHKSNKLEGFVNEQEKKAKETQRVLSTKLEQSFNAVAGTEEGRVALRYIKHICGFGRTKVVGDIQSKTICPISTTFNAAQENIYLQVRKFIRKEHLIKIELTKEI